MVPSWQVCDKAHSLCQFRSLPVSSKWTGQPGAQGQGPACTKGVGPFQGMEMESLLVAAASAFWGVWDKGGFSKPLATPFSPSPWLSALLAGSFPPGST